jgi:hypothetical protein
MKSNYHTSNVSFSPSIIDGLLRTLRNTSSSMTISNHHMGISPIVVGEIPDIDKEFYQTWRMTIHEQFINLINSGWLSLQAGVA